MSANGVPEPAPYSRPQALTLKVTQMPPPFFPGSLLGASLEQDFSSRLWPPHQQMWDLVEAWAHLAATACRRPGSGRLFFLQHHQPHREQNQLCVCADLVKSQKEK